MLYRTRQTIRHELERLAALWRRHGTVVVDSEDDMSSAELLATCDELEAQAKGDGVTALPNMGLILKVIGLVRLCADFIENNPQIKAFVLDLFDQIKELFSGGSGSVV